jgi:hypothetical protein
MIFSRPKFFILSDAFLRMKRHDVFELLTMKRIDTERYMTAYDYFMKNKMKFDGATIVKDLCDIPHLDLSAMIHDYEYIVNLKKRKGFDWLRYKCKVDYQYARDMELLGKGILVPYSRFVLLLLSTPFYLIHKMI